METIMHEIKDEEMPKHSMCLEGLRVKRYKGKGGAFQAMAVPYPKKGTLETDLAKAAQYMEFLKEYFEKKEEPHNVE